jgi:peptide/nickel transport system permease protein
VPGYLARRLLLFPFSLLGAAFLVFGLLRLVPGDVAEVVVQEAGAGSAARRQEETARLRRELGLDRPLGVQFAGWARAALRGDLGESLGEGRPVAAILGERIPRSAELALLAMGLALAWALPLGVLAAARRGTWIDAAAGLAGALALSLPAFLVGVLVLQGLVTWIGWLPPLGFEELGARPGRHLVQVAGPALVQGLVVGGPLVRLVRAEMIEALAAEHVRVARAKGLGLRAVVGRHALRTALPAIVTFAGWWGGRLLGGLVVVEHLFTFPGLGSTLLQAVGRRDYPTIQAVVLVMTLAFLTLNLAIDLVLVRLDPRVRPA